MYTKYKKSVVPRINEFNVHYYYYSFISQKKKKTKFVM